MCKKSGSVSIASVADMADRVKRKPPFLVSEAAVELLGAQPAVGRESKPVLIVNTEALRALRAFRRRMFEAAAEARGPISAVTLGLASNDKEIISAARVGNLGKILGL